MLPSTHDEERYKRKKKNHQKTTDSIHDNEERKKIEYTVKKFVVEDGDDTNVSINESITILSSPNKDTFSSLNSS